MKLKTDDKNSYLPLEKSKYKKRYIERKVEEKEAEEEIKKYDHEEIIYTNSGQYDRDNDLT